MSQNGRVNILDKCADITNLFAMKDKIPVEQTTSFNNAMIGNWTNSELSKEFFSKKNIIVIQKGIQRGVYTKSKGEYQIGFQSEDNLKVIMRSTFLTYSENLPFNIPKQIQALNTLVLEYCVNQVYAEIQSYLKYLYDASTLVVPMSNPTYTSTSKTLELKPWF